PSELASRLPAATLAPQNPIVGVPAQADEGRIQADVEQVVIVNLEDRPLEQRDREQVVPEQPVDSVRHRHLVGSVSLGRQPCEELVLPRGAAPCIVLPYRATAGG